MVRLLVEEFGADLTVKCSPLLHNAATLGKLRLVKYFIESCDCPVDALDADARCTSLPLWGRSRDGSKGAACGEVFSGEGGKLS